MERTGNERGSGQGFRKLPDYTSGKDQRREGVKSVTFVLVITQARSRIVEANFKFTVAIAGTTVNNQWGYGGALVSDQGELRAIFSGPLHHFSFIFAELEAIKMAIFVFLEAGCFGE
ncbi:hypothetical protein V6N12_061550 [Hibiscus sabdariffa]|uniref:RNase H type-1 domain-containing protein n=1 Tax=Hibiscus sabdariffa TaxID=183260 RepID=A0ABR2DXE0_9ROSI